MQTDVVSIQKNDWTTPPCLLTSLGLVWFREEWGGEPTTIKRVHPLACRMQMEVRDAVEADAETLGEIVDLPADVLRNVIHDRTVRVAGDAEKTVGPDADEKTRADEIVGFVAYDVRGGTVHVTQLAGEEQVAEKLLAEPIRFATVESFNVEFVVPVSDTEVRQAAENAGFDPIGYGPRFGEERTRRYRYRVS